MEMIDALPSVYEALCGVECIVKQLKLTIDKMYKNCQNSIGFPQKDMSIGPLTDLTLTSFNKYLLQNSTNLGDSMLCPVNFGEKSRRAANDQTTNGINTNETVTNDWIEQNLPINDVNSTKENIPGGSILMDDTKVYTEKIDRIEQNMTEGTETKEEKLTNNDDPTTKSNSLDVTNGEVVVAEDVKPKKNQSSKRGRKEESIVVRPRKVRISEANLKRLSGARRKSRHIRMSVEKDKKPYKCTYPGCNYAGVKNQYLQVHLRRHEKYACKLCTMKFGDKKLLDKHIHEHDDKVAIASHKDNEKLANEKETQTQNKIEAVVFSCQHCSKEFKKRHNLTNHMKTHEQTEKSFLSED